MQNNDMQKHINSDMDLKLHLKTWSDLQLKLLAFLSNLPTQKIIDATINSDEWLRLTSASKELNTFFYKSIENEYDKELIYKKLLNSTLEIDCQTNKNELT